MQVQVNVFRNDIKNLIEAGLVATRQDNSQIYSYINIRSAFAGPGKQHSNTSSTILCVRRSDTSSFKQRIKNNSEK